MSLLMAARLGVCRGVACFQMIVCHRSCSLVVGNVSSGLLVVPCVFLIIVASVLSEYFECFGAYNELYARHVHGVILRNNFNYILKCNNSTNIHHDNSDWKLNERTTNYNDIVPLRQKHGRVTE